MTDLFDFIFVQGDILATCVNIFIVGIAVDLILGFGALIGDSKKSL